MLRRALLSVTDKTGLVAFARALAARDVELLSTGGTLRALGAEGVPVQSVEEFTGSPEVMDGRVKTLHPRIHGGILARAGRDDADLARIGGRPIDLVVVNLYPFAAVAARPGASVEEILENIDIGGPSLLRSAAKNHPRVAVVCEPADYDPLLAELASAGELSLATRQRLAAKAFAHTAGYDAAIGAYLETMAAATAPEAVAGERPEPSGLFPARWTMSLERVALLRYGENPHQAAAWYRDRTAPAGSLCRARSLDAGGKELSYNNLVDLDAALEAVKEYDEPAAAIIKHTNPCGLAVADELVEAYRLAREGDPQSAFGGIVAVNRPLDRATAALIAETFMEAVIAPEFEPAALELLGRKKQLRLVATGPWPAPGGVLLRRIGGGFVAQSLDTTGPGEVAAARIATQRPPTTAELASLGFAWTVCKHVKSNAIVLATTARRQIVGVGAGQMSRVDSVEIACRKAGERARGAVLASDAFFPFADGVETAVRHGVTAVAQPGGSKRDAEVIAAADAAGIAMVLTGARHFRH